MTTLTWLIVFSAFAAILCARARAGGAALIFGVLAVAMLSVTPVGSDLRDFAMDVADQVEQANSEGVSHEHP